MSVPRGLVGKAQKRQSQQRRETSALCKTIRRRRKEGRGVARVGRAELRLQAQRSYRGWLKILTQTTGFSSSEPEPDNAEVNKIMDTGWGPGRATVQQRGFSDVSVVTEADRLNNLMRDRAVRDVLRGSDKQLVGWKYMTQRDARVRPEHRADDGRVFRVGQKRIRLPRAPRCRCFYLPVLKRKR